MKLIFLLLCPLVLMASETELEKEFDSEKAVVVKELDPDTKFIIELEIELELQGEN